MSITSHCCSVGSDTWLEKLFFRATALETNGVVIPLLLSVHACMQQGQAVGSIYVSSVWAKTASENSFKMVHHSLLLVVVVVGMQEPCNICLLISLACIYRATSCNHMLNVHCSFLVRDELSLYTGGLYRAAQQQEQFSNVKHMWPVISLPLHEYNKSLLKLCGSIAGGGASR